MSVHFDMQLWEFTYFFVFVFVLIYILHKLLGDPLSL